MPQTAAEMADEMRHLDLCSRFQSTGERPMKTYADIKAEISKLERQAEKARKTEIAGVIGRIREAIAAYGLTAQDLGLDGGKSGGGGRAIGKPAAGKEKATVGVAKYRDPESGKTWTGRGKPPNWIVGAKDRTVFLIDKSSPASGPARSAGRKAGKTGRKRAGKNAAKSPAVQIESSVSQ
jgi:DNA-binding protein H-NS